MPSIALWEHFHFSSNISWTYLNWNFDPNWKFKSGIWRRLATFSFKKWDPLKHALPKIQNIQILKILYPWYLTGKARVSIHFIDLWWIKSWDWKFAIRIWENLTLFCKNESVSMNSSHLQVLILKSRNQSRKFVQIGRKSLLPEI